MEEGTHESLMEKRGIYFDLYERSKWKSAVWRNEFFLSLSPSDNFFAF
jgi:hypothetical protein